MSQDNQQEVAVVPQSQVPSVGSPKLGRGHEELSDADDLEIPRAKLVQFTSEETQAANPADRIAAGSIINSINKQLLGELFIPVFKFTSFIQWNPRKKDDPNFDPAFEPGEMVFQTNDRTDIRVVEGIKFGPNNESPKVTKYMNFLCHFVGHSMPVILSFAKTSIAAGKRLNSLTQYAGGDMFAQQFKLSADLRESDGTKYFVLNVKEGGKADAESYKIAENFYDMFRGRSLKVAPEAHAEESH